MFDIGWSELVVIAVVALIAIGPKELPGVLRMVGQWMGANARDRVEKLVLSNTHYFYADKQPWNDRIKFARDDADPATCRAAVEEAYRIEARLSRKVLDSNDAREGPRAFVEKREPNFIGE